MNIEMLDKSVRRIPDFPKPGSLFYDITGVLVNPEALKFCIDQMVEKYKDVKWKAVVLFLQHHLQNAWEFLLY